jgi:hypothetical protein
VSACRCSVLVGSGDDDDDDDDDGVRGDLRTTVDALLISLFCSMSGAVVSVSASAAFSAERVARVHCLISLSVSLIRIALTGVDDSDAQFGFSGLSTASAVVGRGSTVTRSGMASSNASVIFKRPIDELQTSSIESRDVTAQCTNNSFLCDNGQKIFENCQLGSLWRRCRGDDAKRRDLPYFVRLCVSLPPIAAARATTLPLFVESRCSFFTQHARHHRLEHG